MTNVSYPVIMQWPSLLSRDRAAMWSLKGTNATGGRSLTGAITTSRLDGGGLWVAELMDVQVSTPDQIRAWRAIRGIVDGGATPMLMEARDVRCAPWPTQSGALVTEIDGVGFSDGVGFDDGAEFATDVIQAETVGVTALRATSMTIAIENAGDLQGGERFSINHTTFSHHLYEIRTVSDNGDGSFDITFRPPLREATPSGTHVEFDNPKCVMKLAEPAAMDLALQMRHYGSTTIKLVEDFPPFNI